MTRWHAVLAFVAVASSAGCDSTSGVTPVSPTVGVVNTSLSGIWLGSSTVIRPDGFPDTVPSYWQTGSIEPLTVSVWALSSATADRQVYVVRLWEPVSQTNCDLSGAIGADTRLDVDAHFSPDAIALTQGRNRSYCDSQHHNSSWPLPQPYVLQSRETLNLGLVAGDGRTLEGELISRYRYSFDDNALLDDDFFFPRQPPPVTWTDASVAKAVTLSWQGPLP